jgi:cytochrome c2
MTTGVLCSGFVKHARALALATALLSGQPTVAAAQAQSREEPAAPLTGDPRIDEWIRTTFGQPVDRETLDDPVWGTKTLLALSPVEREGARLFMQRCNVCHGAAMNGVVSYGPLLSKKNVERTDDVQKLIRDGTVRMPAFRHALTPEQIDSIIAYLKTVEKYQPVY